MDGWVNIPPLHFTTFLPPFTLFSPSFSPLTRLPPSAPPCPLVSCCDPQGHGACRLESVPSICGPSVWTGWVSLGLHSQPLLAQPLQSPPTYIKSLCTISANSTFCHQPYIFVFVIFSHFSSLLLFLSFVGFLIPYMIHKQTLCTRQKMVVNVAQRPETTFVRTFLMPFSL